MPLINRTSKTNTSGDGSDHSTSLGSSRSKSVDSNEELTHSGTFSSHETDTKQSVSGTIGSFSSNRSKSSVPESPISSVAKEFQVKILGKLEDLVGFGEGPLDVINELDVAQIEDRLPYIAEGDDVFLAISIHGIEISSIDQDIVLKRIPLHEIERLVTYDDAIMGNTILVVKTVNLNEACPEESKYTLYAYQCPNLETGQRITRTFSHALANVLSGFPADEIKLEDLQIT
ncbi:unnamed protein product [Clavelina lepadiformis]|uniref:Uncharacterized protein n=1 Tax=Clavelina lepadiformis TaxID=159417 RepID=A0ABP0GG82_CLALP